MQSSEHNWLISQRQLSHNISFWQVGLLDVVRSEDPDKSHNFTNLIFFMTSHFSTLYTWLFYSSFWTVVHLSITTLFPRWMTVGQWSSSKNSKGWTPLLSFQENQETKSLFYICTQIISLFDWQAFKKKKKRVKTNKPQKERLKRALEEQGKRFLQKYLQSRLKNLWSMV